MMLCEFKQEARYIPTCACVGADDCAQVLPLVFHVLEVRGTLQPWLGCHENDWACPV